MQVGCAHVCYRLSRWTQEGQGFKAMLCYAGRPETYLQKIRPCFKKLKPSIAKSSHQVTYHHLEAYTGWQQILVFPVLINMTLKCWLCANTGERLGKGMVRHRLEPQHTACLTVTLQMLGCSSIQGLFSQPCPVTANMSLPLHFILRTLQMMWPPITQTHDQILNRGPGKEGVGHDRTMKYTVVICSRNDQG